MKSCTLFAFFTAFLLAHAQGAQAQLPQFNYSLTSKPEADRQNLCDQNEGYCITNCGGPNKAPMNFCNYTTMGWGCGCSDKVPDYQAYQWPINYQDCLGRGAACTNACQSDQVPTDQKGACNSACVSNITSKCGTSDQPPAYYKVDNVNQIPTYGPKTTTNGGNNSAGNSSSTNGTAGSSNSAVPIGSTLSSSLGSTVLALMVVAGVMLL